MNVVIIGCGNMGTHHARVFAAQKNISLVGVADCDPEKEAACAEAYSTSPLSSHPYPPCDIAVIATPTDTHMALIEELAPNVDAILCEKPLTDCDEEAEHIVDVCTEHEVVLGIGFVERYNAAVRGLIDAVGDDKPRVIQFERLSPPGTAYGHVVFDLMVHDLDLAQEMFGPATDVKATGDYDAAFALVRFGDVTASFAASRVTHLKRRLITASMDDRVIVADLLGPDVTIRQEVSSAYDATGYERCAKIVNPRLANVEPLQAQAAAFIEAVRNGTPYGAGQRPAVRSVRLASEIVGHLRSDRDE